MCDEKYSMVDGVWKLALYEQDSQQPLASTSGHTPTVYPLPGSLYLNINPLVLEGVNIAMLLNAHLSELWY